MFGGSPHFLLTKQVFIAFVYIYIVGVRFVSINTHEFINTVTFGESINRSDGH